MKCLPRTTMVGIVWILASSITVGSSAGAAGPLHSGTITGSFDSPVLSGAFLQPGTHQPVVCDNTATARASGLRTSSVTWGGDDQGKFAPSALTFSGESFSDVAPGQVFPLGTLTYTNGASVPPSLIFGFTMTLSAGDGTTPFTEPVAIIATQNANADRIADADVLSFPEFEIPSTLAAFEDATVTVTIHGRIADDAQLSVTGMSLAAGEAEHGCVDEGPFVASKGPCAPGCGEVCAAIRLAVAGPLCGAEPLPAVLNGRIGRATGWLSQGATATGKRQVKRAVRLAMKHLRSSATIADRAAEQGRISAVCAKAVGATVASAQRQAAPWLDGR